MRLLLLLPFAGFLCSCAARLPYVQPAPSEPSAELLFIAPMKSTSTLGGYDLYSTDNCQKKEKEGGAASFSLGDSYDDKNARIPVGNRIYVVGDFVSYSGEGVGSGVIKANTYFCRSISSFVPELGHKYQAHATPSGGGCPVGIIDSVSKETPATYQQHKLVGNCCLPNMSCPTQ